MTTEFLYGITPDKLEGLLYFDALELKLKSGEYLYRGLHLGLVEDIDHRKFYVEKALKHTRKLLAERIN